MRVWELALLLFGVTYLIINTTYLIISVKMLGKYDKVFNKSLSFLERFLDNAEKELFKSKE